MGLRLGRTITSLMGTARVTVFVSLFGITWAHAQEQSQLKPQMAEDVFKNVQLLRGIPVSEFLETMGFFSASLNMNCVDCHAEEAAGDWARYANDTEKKQTARKMIFMMRAINQANFGGKRVVTCYSCHRNQQSYRHSEFRRALWHTASSGSGGNPGSCQRSLRRSAFG